VPPSFCSSAVVPSMLLHAPHPFDHANEPGTMMPSYKPHQVPILASRYLKASPGSAKGTLKFSSVISGSFRNQVSFRDYLERKPLFPGDFHV
jgi:hypothetical protein